MTDKNTVSVGVVGPMVAVICLLAVGAGLWFFASGMGGLSENLVYYWSPTQVVEHGPDPEATVRLGGQVEPGTVDFNLDDNVLEFMITDGTSSVPVTCSGAPPQMFREGIGVVVEGALHSDGVFHTSRVMVKHSNEYRAPEEGHSASDIYSTLVVEES